MAAFDGEGKIARCWQGVVLLVAIRMSPGFRPEVSAREPGVTASMRRPLGFGAKRLGDLAVDGAGGEAEGGERGKSFVDEAGDDALKFGGGDGVSDADEHAAAVGDLAEFMPRRWPSASTKGPPEEPGFTAASCWSISIGTAMSVPGGQGWRYGPRSG